MTYRQLHYDDLVTACGHCRKDPGCFVCGGKGYFLTISGKTLERFFFEHILPQMQIEQRTPKVTQPQDIPAPN